LDEYLKRWCRGEVGRSDRVSICQSLTFMLTFASLSNNVRQI
jgi:hypothetical protein